MGIKRQNKENAFTDPEYTKAATDTAAVMLTLSEEKRIAKAKVTALQNKIKNTSVQNKAQLKLHDLMIAAKRNESNAKTALDTVGAQINAKGKEAADQIREDLKKAVLKLNWQKYCNQILNEARDNPITDSSGVVNIRNNYESKEKFSKQFAHCKITGRIADTAQYFFFKKTRRGREQRTLEKTCDNLVIAMQYILRQQQERGVNVNLTEPTEGDLSFSPDGTTLLNDWSSLAPIAPVIPAIPVIPLSSPSSESSPTDEVPLAEVSVVLSEEDVISSELKNALSGSAGGGSHVSSRGGRRMISKKKKREKQKQGKKRKTKRHYRRRRAVRRN